MLGAQQLVAAIGCLAGGVLELPGELAAGPDLEVAHVGAQTGLVHHRDALLAEWTTEPGGIEWSLLTPDGVQRALPAIDGAICADAATPSIPFSDRATIHASLRAFERDETKRLRKETQLPMDAPAPKTICWMEVQ